MAYVETSFQIFQALEMNLGHVATQTKKKHKAGHPQMTYQGNGVNQVYSSRSGELTTGHVEEFCENIDFDNTGTAI